MYKIRRTIPPYIRRRKIKPGVAILIIHPEIRPVGLARFLYYVARVTSRVKKEGYRWQSLWRVRQAQDVTKCTEAPRRLPNCVAIAETSHSSWRCTLHGILPAFFFPGRGVIAFRRRDREGLKAWRIFLTAFNLCRLLLLLRRGL